VLADKLILNNGTVLEGTVIKQEDKYWVKTADGQTRIVPMSDVKSVQKGSGTSSGTPSPSTPGSPAKTLTGDIATVQRRANGVDTPMAAVAIWQEYIDSKPSPDDLKTAREELDKWKKMSTDGAEKINGRWVTGPEYQTLMKKVTALSKEAMQLLASNQALKGEQKLEEARKLYPNSYQVNFLLGYLELIRDNTEKARVNFESVLRLKPKLPEAMANLALISWRKQRWGEAIKLMDDAAKSGDNPQIAFDLNSMINSAPDAVRKSAIVKAAEEDAKLLASKYRVDQSKARNGNLFLIPLYEDSADRHSAGGGVMTGSGFIIASDGLILTNRHVVKDAKTYLVMLNDGKQKSAEVVVIDDEQDLALLRLKDAGKTLPIVKFAPADAPADGAECTVIGYPMVDRLGGSPKITRGIVSSSSSGPKVLGMGGRNQETDVTVDAKVNPGNSGGPIIDRFGNVMAIVAMKSLASETEDSYGMGISAGRIRKFLAKNHIDAPKGEAAGSTLSSEEIAAKIEPSAVLILATH